MRSLLFFLLSLPCTAQIVLNELMASNEATTIPNTAAGTFVDWIELKNTGAGTIDLGGWHLTDDPAEPARWTFPAGSQISPGGFFLVLASGEGEPDANGNLRTNFTLSREGTYLALTEPDLSVASELTSGRTADDESFGRHPTSGAMVYFFTATPGSENNSAGQPRVGTVTFSPTRGFYNSAQTVTLTTGTPGASIYFTTDGSNPLDSAGAPTATAVQYSSPVAITQTTVLRAAGALTNHSPSPSYTHTYLLLETENANNDGTDPGGLNLPFLQQTKPAGYADLSSGDYNMDPDISRSTGISPDHGGQSVAQTMMKGLRDIATISIALPKEGFAGPNGIYTNSESQGSAWERACSAEFIPAANDTRTEFQENCGLRVQGGASRVPAKSPKHSLSFRFRKQYGEGRLRHALFPESEVTEFDSIALRAGYNNSWIHGNSGQRDRASMIRDQWMRESMRDMGHPDAGNGFFAHVFINGLYWGVHNVAERQDNSHFAAYNGGDDTLIDARNGETYANGTNAAWDAMRSTVAGRNWNEILQVLDIDAYIDYQLLQRYSANQDLKVNGNWRAAGGGPFTDPTDMIPWKLYSWDGERVLESVTSTTVPLDPMDIRTNLEAIPEYVQRFGDRANTHLTGDGALTPARCTARWMKYAAALDRAIIVEAARWGDHRRLTPYDRDDWITEQSRLVNTYFPARTANVANRLISVGLLPPVEPPMFTINGVPSDMGYLAPGSILSANTVSGGVIYYTTDGSDPSQINGSPNPSALTFTPQVTTEELFPFEDFGWKFLNNAVAQSSSLVVVGNPSYSTNDWKHPSFNDTAWGTGQALLGDGTITGRITRTNIDIGPSNNRYPTVYFRKEFSVSNINEITSLAFSLVRDDGAIVYLNGREIFRDNIGNGEISYNDFTGTHGTETEVVGHTHFLSPGELMEGSNVIAIEVHNVDTSSSDLGVDLSLSATRTGSTSLVLSQSSELKARYFINGEWSALTTATFLLEPPANASTLAISEISYHPREATLLEKLAAAPLDLEDRDQFEFIELLNTGTNDLNLLGTQFLNGVELQLGLHSLAAGERGVVVRNEAAFLSRYGNGPKIVGTYTGNLNNAGELLTLAEADGTVITEVDYLDKNPWPSRADGDASSLELVDLNTSANNPNNWISSIAYDGSPGTNGPQIDKRIVINEVATNSSSDFMELHNTTTSDIEIGGWLISDLKDVYRSFVIPPTTIPAMGYASFDENLFDNTTGSSITNYSGSSGFSPTTVTSNGHGLNTGDLITISGYGGFSPYNASWEVTVVDTNRFTINTPFLDNATAKGSWTLNRPFGLSRRTGEDLWLVETDATGKPLFFVDHVDFAAARPEQTLGRWLDGDGYDTLITMTSSTKGAANSGPLLGSVYLSEIHYAPAGADMHEFVEITNMNATPTSLANWRLRGGFDFNFTEDHTIAPDSSIVLVSFDPATQTALANNFRTKFSLPANFPLIGPMTDGPLNDDQGTVRLQEAGAPGGNPPSFAQITVDEVRYRSSAPWPSPAGGKSLQRETVLAFGNFFTSWNTISPTPGSLPAPGTTYEQWAASNGAGIATADPDNDTIPNLIEFALGTDPFARTDQPIISNTSITFTSNLSASDVDLQLVSSPDLKTWTPLTTTISATNGLIETREFLFDITANSKLFWRLEASQ